jgi:hypothetical protein
MGAILVPHTKPWLVTSCGTWLHVDCKFQSWTLNLFHLPKIDFEFPYNLVFWENHHPQKFPSSHLSHFLVHGLFH